MGRSTKVETVLDHRCCSSCQPESKAGRGSKPLCWFESSPSHDERQIAQV